MAVGFGLVVAGLGWAVVVVVGSLLAHELAHALVAVREGFERAEVRLSLFGGTTSYASAPRDRDAAVRIAAAGPFVSGVLACLFALAGDHPLLQLGALMNVLALVVNLLPVGDLDGGVLIRSLRRQPPAAPGFLERESVSRPD